MTMVSLARGHAAAIRMLADVGLYARAGESSWGEPAVDLQLPSETGQALLPIPSRHASMSHGHTLTFKLITVAEGVETDGQLEALLKPGCFLSQGHPHHAPMLRRELEEVLARDANLKETSLGPVASV